VIFECLVGVSLRALEDICKAAYGEEYGLATAMSWDHAPRRRKG